MRTNGKALMAIAVTVIAAAAVPPAYAQTAEGFQYVVKFVCGRAPSTRVVAPGEYFTAINVYNPNEGFAFRKKFAIALPGEKAGKSSRFFDTGLGCHEAFEIDCQDILRHLEEAGFVKGFAVIESDHELDVVAVYSAAGTPRGVEAMDVERVKPRRHRTVTECKPDLVPVGDPNNPSVVGLCKRKDGRLIVTVKNQGTASAGPSTTRVDFSTGPATQATPVIPIGGSVDLLFDIPAACFSPDCFFRITVDSGGVVAESNEANNTANGTCLG